MTDRRAFLGRLAASGVALAGSTQLRSETAALIPSAMRDVRAFGAKGDGTTDDTAAFNAATNAAASLTSNGSRYGIFVPPGTYRIDGTVFVRKGQMMVGAGDATVIDASHAKGRTIVLGRDSRDKEDPGGAPATLGEMRFWGGSAKAPLIQASLPGFAIRDLFITAPGIAIEITGGDGIISNIVIDQALNGIILRGARNVLINNVITYLANYAVTIDHDTNDVALLNLIFAYSKNASILFAEAARNIRSVRISGATFVSNIEYPTFVGHVHVRAEAFDAHFSGCVFSNWRGYAVTQEAGSSADLTFANCTFDGSRSHPSYNASSTASGVRTGVNGRFRMNDCRFLHLRGPVALIGNNLREFVIDGGLIDDCRGDPLEFAPQARGRITIRNTDGFGRRIDEKGRSSIVLPWWGVGTLWQISAERGGTPGGITFAAVGAFKSAGIVGCSVTDVVHHGEPIDLVCSFGGTPGGSTTTAASSESGTVCVTTTASDIHWSIRTAT